MIIIFQALFMSRRNTRSFAANSGVVNNRQFGDAISNHSHRRANSRFEPYSPSDSSDSDNQSQSQQRPPTARNNYRNNNQYQNQQGRSRNNYRNNNDNNQNNQNNRSANFVPKKNQNKTDKSQREYIPPPQPRPTAYIELIPCHFNSLQVRMLSDQLWASGNIPEIRNLLHFFESLRKAIIHMNVKERMEVLDPRFPAMLEALQPAIPESFSFFSEEITPRIDNSTEYDEETWAKMFIQLLPRPCHKFPITMEVFSLMSEISQQITQSESAVIRHTIINDAKGPMKQELNKLGDLQDRYMWSQEKYDAEEQKVIKKWNAKIYEKRKEREMEIYKMYDTINEYFNDGNVSNFNDRFVLGSWRFLLRNPCFPLNTIQIGDKSFPAEQFSFVEVFNNPLISYSETFSYIRSWFYSKHPTINAIKPNQVEFQDWMSICLYYNVLTDLIGFASTKPDITNIASFDHQQYRFYTAWIHAQYGKPLIINSEKSNYTLILEKKGAEVFSAHSGNAWLKSHEVYPYHELRLYEESYENEVGRIINSINENDFAWKSLLIKSFNHDVIKQRIVSSLVSGDCLDVNAMLNLATHVGVDMNEFSALYISELMKNTHPSESLIHSVAVIALFGIFNEPIEQTFERFYTIFANNNDNLAELLKGFSLCISTNENECRILKPRIVEIATDIASKSRFGAAKFLSLDVCEAFAKLD